MSNLPDIAVMMMTYNGEAYLRQSLDSLAAQSYRGFYLVFVDDCSSDSSFEIASEYVDKFEHAVFIRNSQNKGSIKNLHDTLCIVEEAVPQANFFIWACADDWWEPEFLEKTRNHLLQHDEAVVCQTWFDTILMASGQKVQQKLASVSAQSYKEASKIFYRHVSDVEPAYYNFVLHGLIRMPVLRLIYPDSIKDIAYSACTELSGLAYMLLRGDIHILPEYLMHRRDNGRFADRYPQDSLSRYYKNIPLRIFAVFNHLPAFLRCKPKNCNVFTVLLLWLHLFYFYGILSTAIYIRDSLISILTKHNNKV